MGYRTKTLFPTNANLLRPKHATPEIAEKLKLQQIKQQFYYNKTAKPLRPLQEGDIVRAKPYQLNTSSWEKATVTKKTWPKRSKQTTASLLAETERNYEQHTKILHLFL